MREQPEPARLQGCAIQDFFDNKLSPRRLFQRLPRGGHTRSLSEHGSQAPHRRWYLAYGPGRVGRRWILEAPCPIGRGPLRFYRPLGPYAGRCPWPGLALAATACQYRPLAAHGPLPQTPRGLFCFYTEFPARVMLTKVSIGFSCQRHPEPVSGAASCACAVVLLHGLHGVLGAWPLGERVLQATAMACPLSKH